MQEVRYKEMGLLKLRLSEASFAVRESVGEGERLCGVIGNCDWGSQELF